MHGPYRPAGALLFRRASRVICVSEAEAALVRRDFPGTSARIQVIPNGVEKLRASGAPYHLERRVVLAGGRLERYKGLHRVVAALPALGDGFELAVTGDGPARDDVAALAAELGVEERVRLLGRVSDEALARWFRTAAVYVSMSAHEAFGLTLLEALGTATPVVASDIPAHREVAASASGGITLVPLDAPPAELAAHLREAAATSPPRDALDSTLSWEDVARRTLELYRAITAGEAA
jgi:glycosyltransferase involved in cell wall biosynthesis